MATQQLNQTADAPLKKTLLQRLAVVAQLPNAAAGWISQRPLKRGALLLVAAAAILAASAIAWYALGAAESAANRATAQNALALLDAGDFDNAKRLAIQLQQSESLAFEEASIPLYVLGATLAHDAATQWKWDGFTQRQVYLVAARYLDESRARGFPEGRDAEGYYLLGNSLFHGRRYADSVPVLLKALSSGSPRVQLFGYLSDAYAKLDPPQYDQALQYSQKFLDDPALRDRDRHAGLLRHSEILLRLDDLDASRQSLALIPADSSLRPEVDVIQARLRMRAGDRLLAEADDVRRNAATEKFSAATEALRQLTDGGTSAAAVQPQALYLLGECYRKLGELDKAEQLLGLSRRQNDDPLVALAAGLAEADVQRSRGDDGAAVASYVRVLHEAGDAADYSNPWVALDEFQGRIVQAYFAYRNSARFELAVQIAKALWPAFPRARAAELLAETYLAWAEGLLLPAAGQTSAEARESQAAARKQFRLAGKAFSRLAQIRYATAQYTDDLWNSADSFLRGQDFRSSIRLLNAYLKNEPNRRIARARVALGESHLALHEVDDALVYLAECIEFNTNDPDIYRARLLASQAQLEKGSVAEAQQLLLDNLENDFLTPQSTEWRDSLFALGKLLHRQADERETASRQAGVDSENPDAARKGLVELEQSYQLYQQAIGRLDVAVRRYPDAPQTIEARYLMAESSRQAAKWPRKRLPTVTIETTRAELSRQMKRELEAAEAAYAALERDLIHRQDQGELTEIEQAMLRNCFFARADVLFDMGRYQDAIGAYSSATNRYHDQPEALEGLVQIASCHRRTNRFDEARKTLQQAQEMLERIPPDAQFTNTTRFDRAEWAQLLNLLITL